MVVGMYMATSPTCPACRKCEILAINPIPVLAQESVQEILPYAASRHVMKILNYCIVGRFISLGANFPKWSVLT